MTCDIKKALVLFWGAGLVLMTRPGFPSWEEIQPTVRRSVGVETLTCSDLKRRQGALWTLGCPKVLQLDGFLPVVVVHGVSTVGFTVS